MDQATSLKVAGVPEAFNDCWHKADFLSQGLQSIPTFIPHPGGSGSMLKALQAGEIDTAFALTDCIVAAIENGSPVRLAGPLVKSPLTWGVIVAAKSAVSSLEELNAATWGVSRIGSGSHVMVQTMAKKRAWEVAPKFEVCGNFEGLRNAVNEGRVDAFLWEVFTTRPFERGGEVRIIDGVPTPWGCFSVAVRRDCDRVEEVGKVVDAFLDAGKEFLKDDGSVQGIVDKYGMTVEDAKRWIEGVLYAERGERRIDRGELEMTRNVLRDAGVIKEFLCQGGLDAYHV